MRSAICSRAPRRCCWSSSTPPAARGSAPVRAYGLLAVFAFSLAMNIVFLRDGADFLRTEGRDSRINLAMLELRPASSRVRMVHPPKRPLSPRSRPGRRFPKSAALPYFNSVTRYGSPAMTVAELSAEPPAQRAAADATLVAAGSATIQAVDEIRSPMSDAIGSKPASSVALPTGFSALEPADDAPVDVTVSRFWIRPGSRSARSSRDVGRSSRSAPTATGSLACDADRRRATICPPARALDGLPDHLIVRRGLPWRDQPRER